MAHPSQIKWCEQIKEQFPTYFYGKRVLDIGSLDVNGNNRYLFDNCEYIGLDVVPGPNVDAVGIAHMYKPSATFDVVLSTNALEHDLYWQKTLCAMLTFLKPGGLMFFSTCSTWGEHGTKRTTPDQSGTSQMGVEWENFFRNFSTMDIYVTLDFSQIEKFDIFTTNSFEIGYPMDLRFWALKKVECAYE
ncbi:MAG: methyltransferase domain-containing protein [Nitrospinales bacterium]